MEIVGTLIALMLIALGIGLYFTPYLIGRDKENSTGIFLLNLFLGWTLVGWLGALIWALLSPKLALWTYKCPHCNFVNELHQRITLLACKQCLKESKIVIKK